MEEELSVEEWRLNSAWVGICVAALIAGFAAGWCWRDRPGALAQVSLLSVLTAVGTLSAVGVALWVSLQEGQRRRRELLQQAKMSAIAARPLIGTLALRLGRAIELWNSDAETFIWDEKQRKRLAKDFTRFLDKVDRIQTKDIVYGAAECGTKVMEGLARLDTLILLLTAAKLEDEEDEECIVSTAQDAFEYFDEAMVDLRHAGFWT